MTSDSLGRAAVRTLESTPARRAPRAEARHEAIRVVDVCNVDSSANINKIYGELSTQGLNPVEWGGDIEVIRTSATTGQAPWTSCMRRSMVTSNVFTAGPPSANSSRVSSLNGVARRARA